MHKIQPIIDVNAPIKDAALRTRVERGALAQVAIVAKAAHVNTEAAIVSAVPDAAYVNETWLAVDMGAHVEVYVHA